MLFYVPSSGSCSCVLVHRTVVEDGCMHASCMPAAVMRRNKKKRSRKDLRSLLSRRLMHYVLLWAIQFFSFHINNKLSKRSMNRGRSMLCLVYMLNKSAKPSEWRIKLKNVVLKLLRCILPDYLFFNYNAHISRRSQVHGRLSIITMWTMDKGWYGMIQR